MAQLLNVSLLLNLMFHEHYHGVDDIFISIFLIVCAY